MRTGKKMSTLSQLLIELSDSFEDLRPKVIQPPEGYLKYPYLIPAGFYKQMWDWDGFFMGAHFANLGQPSYLKYWALNLMEGIDENGYVSGGATTAGPRVLFGKFAMKPFLSQGVCLASQHLDDFNWTAAHYSQLKKVLTYREKTQRDEKTRLFYWDNGMQSGADNNVALNYKPNDNRSFLAPDASTWQCREYKAQSILAEKLGKTVDANIYRKKYEDLKKAMNDYLWCEEDQVFYTIDRHTGQFHKRLSYLSFVPLFEGVVCHAKGRATISRYLLNPDHMKANFGLRSLSKKDVDYNNENIILPFSNWQGPVWPIANFIYATGLKRYGFECELEWLAETLGMLLLNDIKQNGTMHENYHADTGSPLAPGDEYKDDLGKIVGFISWNLCFQNILEGVVNDNWMLLDINP